MTMGPNTRDMMDRMDRNMLMGTAIGVPLAVAFLHASPYLMLYVLRIVFFFGRIAAYMTLLLPLAAYFSTVVVWRAFWYFSGLEVRPGNFPKAIMHWGVFGPAFAFSIFGLLMPYPTLANRNFGAPDAVAFGVILLGMLAFAVAAWLIGRWEMSMRTDAAHRLTESENSSGYVSQTLQLLSQRVASNGTKLFLYGWGLNIVFAAVIAVLLMAASNQQELAKVETLVPLLPYLAKISFMQHVGEFFGETLGRWSLIPIAVGAMMYPTLPLCLMNRRWKKMNKDVEERRAYLRKEFGTPAVAPIVELLDWDGRIGPLLFMFLIISYALIAHTYISIFSDGAVPFWIFDF